MKKTLLILSIALWLTNYCQTNQESINNLYSKSEFVGIGVSKVSADSIYYIGGLGYSDKLTKTAYNETNIQLIASVSKTFIGVALIQCLEKSEYTLDSEINSILPFTITNPHHPNTPIKIKHLVTHTSSIDFDIPDYSKITFIENQDLNNYSPKIVKQLKKTTNNSPTPNRFYLFDRLNQKGKLFKTSNFLKTKVGSQYKYSNIGALLTAYIVEILSGKSFDAYCEENIFKPLELKSAHFDVTKCNQSVLSKQYFGKTQLEIPQYNHLFYPTGGLYMSLSDLSKYLQECINGFNKHGKLLSSEGYQIMFKDNFKDISLPENFPKSETGHGVFWTYKNNMIGHTGGGLGATSFMFFDINKLEGKIFITNCEIESNEKLIPQFLSIWKELD